MITTERKRCNSKTHSGKPCRGFAIDDGYCFSHSPALEKKRLEARAKGGKNSSRAVRLKRLVPPRLSSRSGKGKQNNSNQVKNRERYPSVI